MPFERLKLRCSSLNRRRLFITLTAWILLSFFLFLVFILSLKPSKTDLDTTYTHYRTTTPPVDITENLIASLDVTLTGSGVRYVAFYGTLLGSVRHGGKIPWDLTPVDLLIDKQLDRNNFLSKIRHTLMLFGLEISTYKFGYKITHRVNITLSAILYEFTELNGKIKVSGDDVLYAVSDIFPHLHSPFHKFMMKVPKNYKSILSQIYGDWSLCVNGKHSEPCSIITEIAHVPESYERIPKILHQAWLGPRSAPEYSLQTCRDMHPDWEYRFWNDTTARSLFPLDAQQTFDGHFSLNGKGDILRWEILKRFGGVWVDADVFCFRPLDQLLENPDRNFLAVSTVGSIPHHPLIHSLVEKIKYLPKHYHKAEAWRTLGPRPVSILVSKLNHIQLASMGIGSYPFYMFLPYNMYEPVPIGVPDSSWPKVVQYGSYCLNFWGTTFKSYFVNGTRPTYSPTP
eukprot:TRINITY_DN6099_c0_g1_i4.p1 TRINITY_DN6099_c0_g1~~TRINITY_DN6099_c0_g1_i4.p1  ORF type:complete len:456 (-),score=49.15 TRINITY_DN6099_c0_g1_i4:47-1414(-)